MVVEKEEEEEGEEVLAMVEKEKRMSEKEGVGRDSN